MSDGHSTGVLESLRVWRIDSDFRLAFEECHATITGRGLRGLVILSSPETPGDVRFLPIGRDLDLPNTAARVAKALKGERS